VSDGHAPSTHEVGPRPLTQALIGAALLALAAALWIDAAALPPPTVMGVGPSAAPRLVGAILAVLGVAHWFAAWRGRGQTVAVDRGNHRSLSWVMAALVGLILVLQFGGGFVLGSAWLFIATARGFGEALRLRSLAIGLGLSLLVYLFFTRVLTLALPAGPLERLLLG
jgi:putative tricarboxylic transport membrane protein